MVDSIDEARKILGVTEESSDEEIKDAYRKKAKETHPDKNSGDDKKFKELQDATDIILSKKNELELALKAAKIVHDGYKKIDLKKEEFLAVKNKAIQNVNNRLIKRGITTIGSGLIILFLINSLEDFETIIQEVTPMFADQPEFLAMFKLMSVIIASMLIIITIVTSMRSRMDEMQKIENEYKENIGQLIDEL